MTTTHYEKPHGQNAPHERTGERPLNLVVVSAGTSVPSSTRMLADQLTKATRDALAQHGQIGRAHV